MAATTRDFHHPYEPYPIQQEFMTAVYDCLEQGNVGIFESPTGTGKSLSLICGSLTWLRDHQRKTLASESGADATDAQEPDWMLEHARLQKHNAARARNDELNSKLIRIRAKEDRAKARYESNQPPLKRQKQNADAEGSSDEANFALDDYESDDEAQISARPKAQIGLNATTQALLAQLRGPLQHNAKEDAELEYEDEPKIFFCSRTHSQLNQLTSELRKLKLPPAITSDSLRVCDDLVEESPEVEEIKQVALGSRKNLCINHHVSKLGSAAAITERCLELQQPSTPGDRKCQFLPTKENENLALDFRDHTLARIRDIEDMGQLGKKLGICPYYASRKAVKPSEVVTLPYPLLLQKSAREALNISLKGHVVIIDEAHNLLDAITNVHSVSITLNQLFDARFKVGTYLQKFRNRLRGKNRVYVTNLVRVIDSLTTYLDTQVKRAKNLNGLVETSELLTGKAVDQVNLYKLMHYLEISKLARKVDGYNESIANHASSARKHSGTVSNAKGTTTPTPVLNHVQAFLLALTYPAAEGRFFYSNDKGQGAEADSAVLKYLLLDPVQHFKEVVDEARAVILAGGTMSPMSEYTEHLLHYMPSNKVQTLSYGHVIPPSNLVAMPVTKGPTGKSFDFTFEKRSSDVMLDELGRAIVELAHCVPDGLVLFFPSYAYLDTACERWQTKLSSSSDLSLWHELSKAKPIFRESNSKRVSAPDQSAQGKSARRIEIEEAASADEVLAAYSSCIFDENNRRGALLFAVIGGSLSEGINFADGLGRGVVVVGLPFPNAHSPELKEKLNFVEQRVHPSSKGATAASQEFYTNICMRAVNQSIGRAIRHKDDYAAIMLLDQRYDRESIKSKLPQWIRDSLSADNVDFSERLRSVRRFFLEKGDWAS